MLIKHPFLQVGKRVDEARGESSKSGMRGWMSHTVSVQVLDPSLAILLQSFEQYHSFSLDSWEKFARRFCKTCNTLETISGPTRGDDAGF